MSYRLLIDTEAVAFMDSMPKKLRAQLIGHFTGLRSTPHQLSDFHQYDRIGHRVEISIFAGLAIHYWVDLTDRHIKILTTAEHSSPTQKTAGTSFPRCPRL